MNKYTKEMSESEILIALANIRTELLNVVDTIKAIAKNIEYKGDDTEQVDVVQGEWIKATGMMPPEFHNHHCCSECGNFANMEPPFGNREDLSNFCPNCGADMRGKEE